MQRREYMSKPNVIVIFSDQHRYDWISGLGCNNVSTPNLDKLSKNGVTFTDAYCNSPLCGPSRMSFLTGRGSFRNKIYINEDCLDSNTPTFVHAFGLAGYETVLAGRMHYMGADQRHGFEKRLAGDICRTYPGIAKDDIYENMEGSASSTLKALEFTKPGSSPVLDYDDAATSSFERFINERKTEEKPLFAVVGWYSPHNPYIAPLENYNKAKARMADDKPVPMTLPLHPWVKRWMNNSKVTNPSLEKIMEVRYNYAGMIDKMDESIGRVLKAAEKLKGETLIVYLSDHGEMAGDRGMFAKTTFYESSVKVPLIFSQIKGDSLQIAKDKKVSVPVSLVDMAPTFASIIGAPEIPSADGQDISRLLKNGETGSDLENRGIVSEQLLYNTGINRMLKKGDYKYCWYSDFEEPMLFNLKNDPLEQNNLSADKKYLNVLNEMHTELMKDCDIAAIERDFKEKRKDMSYVVEWCRKVNKNRGEMWNPSKPVYEYNDYGNPKSYL
jgi:choline-sulfatase